MKSAHSAISKSPAYAAPLTAAIIGTGQSIMARIARSKIKCWSCHCSSVMPLRCFRSPPAQNAFSPDPVITIHRCWLGAAQKPSNVASRSRPIWVFIELATSGRFSVTRTVFLRRFNL